MHDIAPASAVDLIRSPKLPWSLRRCFRALLGIEYGSLDVALPDGRIARFFGPQSGPHARFSIRSYAFVKRLGAGDVGFAEGYLAGEWECDDLVALLGLLAVNRRLIDRFAANPLVRAVQMARHWRNRNSRAGSRRNIHAHYDLGNDFYAAWLDPTLSYSSARFDGQAITLEAAQRRKIAAIAGRVAGAGTVLEIGCGWGSLARHLADQGMAVTAISLSDEQLAWARQRHAGAGIDFRKQDYRDIDGRFDAIASVEMVEAVGQDYWPDFFDCLARCLKPGGRVALQYIAIRDDIFEGYARSADFIQTYVFPGGMLVRESAFRRLAAERGLSWEDQESFGLDYAQTLRMWRENFDRAVGEGRLPAGFDDRFVRLWRFYLMYCEGGFRGGGIDVAQVTLVKGG